MKKYHDWKDVAGSYYEKCLSLTVLLALFAFLVTPEIEVKARKIETDKMVVVEEAPPEFEEEIKPPEAQPLQDLEIVIEDIGEESEEEELSFIETMESSVISEFVPKKAPPKTRGKTPDFVVYEDEPVLIKQVRPEYPQAAKDLEIEGTVVLKLEILEDGKVGAVKVIKKLLPQLDEAARVAASQFEYTPAKFQGKPVAVWLEVALVFTLE